MRGWWPPIPGRTLVSDRHDRRVAAVLEAGPRCGLGVLVPYACRRRAHGSPLVALLGRNAMTSRHCAYPMN